MVTPRYLADATLLIAVLPILYSEFRGSRLFEMVRCSHFDMLKSINQSLDHWYKIFNPLVVFECHRLNE